MLWGGLALALALVVSLAASESQRGTDRRDEGARGEVDAESARMAGVSSLGARPSRGPADASVTVVEFTDYQCPFCTRHFEQTYPLLMQQYGDRIRYAVRNFPLVRIHPHAAKAAEAAECAHDQGRFWEYHDRLFENNAALDVESLKRYAADLDLEVSQFNKCLDSGRKSEIVARDLEDGSRLGVRGTPTFFINGRILVGAQPYPVFRDAVELALQQASAERSGTPE
ncbi:MAG: thioredoxin domain-containing protein [Gemmatimonadetes bacterium]|nr:thioredoxin domain-containing protein [Gemmatimonadota bacterium]